MYQLCLQFFMRFTLAQLGCGFRHPVARFVVLLHLAVVLEAVDWVAPLVGFDEFLWTVLALTVAVHYYLRKECRMDLADYAMLAVWVWTRCWLGGPAFARVTGD